jgi:hypothetical protein
MLPGEEITLSKRAACKAQLRTIKKSQSELLSRAVTSLFPHKPLKVLIASSVGSTNNDYGGRCKNSEICPYSLLGNPAVGAIARAIARKNRFAASIITSI